MVQVAAQITQNRWRVVYRALCGRFCGKYKAEAERFLQELRDRLEKFGLSLHPDKTRLIEFGRYAEGQRRNRGGRRPKTFDFLGFMCIKMKACTLVRG